MKKKGLKTFIFLALALLCSAEKISAQIDTYIKYITNDTNADVGCSIAQTPDGNYIISAVTGGQIAFYCSDGWIIKINPDGDTLWTRRVGGNGTDMLGNIIIENNKYITVGFKYVFLSERQGWLLKYDSAGNKIIDKTYGGPLDDALVDIVPSGDGGFLSLGSTKSFGTDSTQDAWLVRFNSDLDTIWTKHYDLGDITGDSSFTDIGNGILPFGNNSYLMSINTCRLCDGTDGIAWYTLIDSIGNIIGSPHIFDEGPKNKFEGGIRSTADGGAIITGATSMIDSLYSHFPPLPPLRSEDIWIVKINSDADTAWTKIYGKDSIYDGGWSIFQTADGGYFMSAYSQIGCTTGYDFDNVWLMRLNSVGDTVQVCRWGGPQNDDLFCIIPAADGGAIGVGWYNASSLQLPIPGDCDIIIMKTDCNAIVDVADFNVTDYEISVYPNPASDNVFIESPLNENNQKLYCELYSFDGSLVKKTEVQTNILLDISGMPSGLYFIKVVMKNKILINKIVILR